MKITWHVTPALCLSCGHAWVAVYPSPTPLLFECSKCGALEGVRNGDDE